jgi:hypothetical protein
VGLVSLLAVAPSPNAAYWLLWTGQNFFAILGAFGVLWTIILTIAYIPARRRFEMQTRNEASARKKTIDDLERRREELAGELADLADRRAEARFSELLEECRWLSERSDQLAEALVAAGIACPSPLRPQPIRLRTNRILRENDM